MLRNLSLSFQRPPLGRMSFIPVMGVAFAGFALISRAEVPPPHGTVAILYSDHKSYRTAAAALEELLTAQKIAVVNIAIPKADDDEGRKAAIAHLMKADVSAIAATGMDAAVFATQERRRAPVAFFMAPNAHDAPFVAKASKAKNRVIGITTDVSPKDQLSWIKKISPSIQNIAILHSGRTKRTVDMISQEAKKRHLKVHAIDCDKDAFPDAIKKLNDSKCDSVLMIPDARVYNATTIRRLLLWGLRNKKPVWTFSANVVKAGALAGIYASQEQMTNQMAELLIDILKGKERADGRVKYPAPIQIAVNVRTAEMIGVRLDEKILPGNVVKFGEKP